LRSLELPADVIDVILQCCRTIVDKFYRKYKWNSFYIGSRPTARPLTDGTLDNWFSGMSERDNVIERLSISDYTVLNQSSSQYKPTFAI